MPAREHASNEVRRRVVPATGRLIRPSQIKVRFDEGCSTEAVVQSLGAELGHLDREGSYGPEKWGQDDDHAIEMSIRSRRRPRDQNRRRHLRRMLALRGAGYPRPAWALVCHARKSRWPRSRADRIGAGRRARTPTAGAGGSAVPAPTTTRASDGCLLLVIGRGMTGVRLHRTLLVAQR